MATKITGYGSMTLPGRVWLLARRPRPDAIRRSAGESEETPERLLDRAELNKMELACSFEQV